ncbi:MAG: ferritin-like domain-containing protein [Alistipes sp.]
MDKQLQNKYQKSINLLNDAIGKEIATSLQYMYFHVHFEDAGYKYLSRLMRQISIAEMRHIEEFAERIIYLQGDVNMNASFQTRQILEVTAALELCVQLEQSTIEGYNISSHACAVHADAVSHKMFQDVIAEEEKHHDLFRTELQNMVAYGDEYLAMQSIAGSKDHSEFKM